MSAEPNSAPQELSQLNTVTPQMAGQLAKLLGVDEAQVNESVRIGGPLLLAALAGKAAAPEGADAVLAMVNQAGSSSSHDIVTAVERGQGDALTHQLFGAGLYKVAATIRDATGFDIAPYLPALLPLMLGVLHNTVKSKQLDAAGLASWLKSENDAFAKTDALLAQQVKIAVDAGAQAVTIAEQNKARFTAEEWETLASAPALAGYAVMMSSMSGPVGMTKEVMALTEIMSLTAHQAPGDTLIGLVSQEFEDPEKINALGANRENASARALQACSKAVEVLQTKATVEEAYEYKQFVMATAERVAEAAKEGTFLGMGGTLVNAAEQAMLDQIAAALNYKR